MINFNDFFKALSYEEVKDFGKSQKNRKINEKHVNEFVNILKNKEFVPVNEDGDILVFDWSPIIVNPTTNHIMDGQHKKEAFIKAVEKGLIPSNAKILVAMWSIADEEHENYVTVMLNSHSRNWGLQDYLNAYAFDIESYSKLREFCLKHALCYTIPKNSEEKVPSYRYGAAIITGKGCATTLKAGSFNFTDDEFAVADIIHREMEQIRRKLNITETSRDLEGMAVQWHKQREVMTVDEICSLSYIPASVRERQIKNGSDWFEVFSVLGNIIERKRKEKAA